MTQYGTETTRGEAAFCAASFMIPVAE